MAHVTDIRAGGTSFTARIGATASTLVSRFVDYRNYRATLSQLRVLSNRELDDLGLSRGELHDVAYKSAYGHRA